MQPHRSERVHFALDDHEGIAAHRTHHERRAFLLAEGAPPPLAGPPPVPRPDGFGLFGPGPVGFGEQQRVRGAAVACFLRPPPGPTCGI